ncbi:hypothetical protein INT47_012589 [Mucor saturninus]|uniref:Uncharacterized protein n=1 Tax=Mucor saturninus TaxID=64648 RepID=A0A8H7V291_9FUNG|nr:hypothetical protein INT47_012589 [Mucor saturninus]
MNLLTKFRNEYKKIFSDPKRCPSLILDFDTLWYQAQADKALEIERNKLSLPILQSTTDLLRQRINTQDINSNSSNTHSSNIDSSEPNDSEEEPFTTNEEAFLSRIILNEETPLCLQEFRKFQDKAFSRAKTYGLFVNSNMFEVLSLQHIVLLKKHTYKQIDVEEFHENMLDNYISDSFNVEKDERDSIKLMFLIARNSGLKMEPRDRQTL